jgi:hypothetical protein
VGFAVFSTLAVYPLMAAQDTEPKSINSQEIYRQEIYIQRQPNDTYAALVQRAVLLAQAIAQQKLRQIPQMAEISITAIVENNGLLAPVLNFRVSRKQHEKGLEEQKITYFSSSRILLGFSSPSVTPTVTSPSNSLPLNALPPDPPGSPL